MSSKPSDDAVIKKSGKIVDRLWPTISRELGGLDPVIQGCVLAQLTATWLAGHQVPGDAKRTKQLRAELLDLQIDAVEKLIPVFEREIDSRG